MNKDTKYALSGFTLVRNGTRFDYPYLESLRSLLPMVQQLVINVGIGDDDTFSCVKKFAEEEGQGKVIYFESDWQLDQPEKKRGGLILSEQTNLALQRCSSDWCLYLQADEVLHEEDYSAIRSTLEQAQQNVAIEGIVFNYIHFYGSFDVMQESRNVYRREVRLIRRSAGVQSVGDAQGFRKKNGEKLIVLRSQARVFHYGWVRPPEKMKEKTFHFDQLYHGTPSSENAEQGTPHTGDNYRYKRIWGLRRFRGTHPSVMHKRILQKGWHWDLEQSPRVFSVKDLKKVILDSIEQWTGYRFFEYRNYRIFK